MQIVIVTGCSRGLGLAIVKDLLKKDVQVIGTSRNSPNLDNFNNFKFVAGDITDETVMKRIVEEAKKAGTVKAVIHNAGTLEPLARVDDYNDLEWKKAFDINLHSPMRLTSLLLPIMEKSGNILFISSGAAVNGYQGWGAYCASKAALLLAGKCLAKEVDGVNVLSIRPGVVDTDMQTFIRENGKAMGSDLERFIELKSTGKLLSPDTVGQAISSLAFLPSIPAELNGELINWNDERLSK